MRFQVYAGPLEDGARAAVVFNRHTAGTQYPISNVTVRWEDLGGSRRQRLRPPGGRVCVWLCMSDPAPSQGSTGGEASSFRACMLTCSHGLLCSQLLLLGWYHPGQAADAVKHAAQQHLRAGDILQLHVPVLQAMLQMRRQA